MASAYSNRDLFHQVPSVLPVLDVDAQSPLPVEHAGVNDLPVLQTESVCFEPILTYTKRRVGFVATCGRSAVHLEEREWAPVAPTRSRLFLDQFAMEPVDALHAFSVPLSYSVEKCRSHYPKGSLLLLESPSASWTEQSLLEHCKTLAANSFKVGISSYCGSALWSRSFPLLSHIRIDLATSLPQHTRNLIASPLRRTLLFIACGVADSDSLTKAMEVGFQLFQGSFVSQVPRLRWSATDLEARVLLLQRSCAETTVTVELLEDMLAIESVCGRFNNLLLSAALHAAQAYSSPAMLFAELGQAETQRFAQLALVHDIVGSSSGEYVRQLFELARFHELLRGHFSSARTLWARLEGLLVGVNTSLDSYTPAERLRSLADRLKINIGVSLYGSALQRNVEITHAFRSADWIKAYRLSKEDNLDWDIVNDLWHRSVAWSSAYTSGIGRS